MSSQKTERSGYFMAFISMESQILRPKQEGTALKILMNPNNCYCSRTTRNNLKFLESQQFYEGFSFISKQELNRNAHIGTYRNLNLHFLSINCSESLKSMNEKLILKFKTALTFLT